MLNWIRRRAGRNAEKSAEPASAAEAAAAPNKPPLAENSELWLQRLEAGRGNDDALLELARATPLLDIKLSAVEALQGEAALKQAEREFRSHDRKVHQRVRQRLAAAIAQREARARAEALIEAARALAGARPLAANRLADLDRAWQALSAAALEPMQRDAFATLRDALDTLLREQDEHQRADAWAASAASVLAELQQACTAGDMAAIEAQAAAAQSRLDARPATGLVQALAESLQAAVLDARDVAAAALAAAPPAVARPPPPIAPARPARPDWLPRIEAMLRQAEEALAAGSSSGLDRELQVVDTAIAELPHGSTLPVPLRARLQALHDERRRLKGWQQWGGAVAREGLVDAAEALAHSTEAAVAGPPAAKLNLKTHGEAIRKLRARWKELDRTGAAANQALWQRFDAALTLAHEPVAAQQAALKAARENNLAAREALLVAFDEAAGRVATQRETLQALDDFQRAWRKLGPVEHTVPVAAVGALRERFAAALARVEAPLIEARAVAQSEREALVERAEALAAQEGRDDAAQLRELQTRWQQHARALPLARGVEAALWARFRQASDAVFARREAAAQARDAEAAAGIAAREALLQRLDALAQDASLPPADLVRAIGQVDREWRQLFTPLPRAVADGLEARYRDAHGVASRSAEARRIVQWQAQCDALRERLALCELRESAAEGGAADALAQRWQSAGATLEPWQRVLESRYAGAAGVGAPSADADTVDLLLLRLEDALGVAPAPAQAQARRELKLRALKDALEGRAVAQVSSEASRPMAWLAELLARRGLSAAQRERLQALLGALRAAPQRLISTER